MLFSPIKMTAMGVCRSTGPLNPCLFTVERCQVWFLDVSFSSRFLICAIVDCGRGVNYGQKTGTLNFGRLGLSFPCWGWYGLMLYSAWAWVSRPNLSLISIALFNLIPNAFVIFSRDLIFPTDCPYTTKGAAFDGYFDWGKFIRLTVAASFDLCSSCEHT